MLMKKLSILKQLSVALLIAMLGITLVGCDDNDGVTKKDNDKEKNENVEENKELTFGLDETAVFPNLEITALEIKKSEGDEYFKPDEGNVNVGVKISIKNISDKTEHISSVLLFDAYVDDKKQEFSFVIDDAFSGGTLDGELEAGKMMEGWYTMELPTDAKTLDLVIKDNWLSKNKAKFTFDLTKVD